MGNVPAGSVALEHGSEEAVRVVHVGQHLEVVAEALPLLRVKDDLLALEDFLRRNEVPLGVFREEGFDHA